MGRGKGDNVRALVYQLDMCGPEEWHHTKFMIFDSPPASKLCANTFEVRIDQLKERLTRRQTSEQGLNVEVVEMHRCTGFDHLYSMLSDILEKVTTTLADHQFSLRVVRASCYANPIRRMNLEVDQTRC
jgi:hypothetical protein